MDVEIDNSTIVSQQIQRSIVAECREIGETVRKAVFDYGVVTHPIFGQIFAFEVDCYGSQLLMDDANTPSLLSLPILGFIEKTDPVYINTRNFVLSDWNPWFFNGTFASGIGGPHTGQNMVWPMSILMQIQTSNSELEITKLIDILKRMAKVTGNLMCESFHVDKPSHFTRPWFSWANGLAGSTILRIIKEFPHLA
jgi:meiotically up-regulated gene 157 (Mug157) protein